MKTFGSSTWRRKIPLGGVGAVAGAGVDMLSVAGELHGSFYLFSGARLKAGPRGKAVREYLRDAYRFTPGQGWRRLADLPCAAVAAPSPAAAAGNSLLIFSGDDGTHVDFQSVERHPVSPRRAGVRHAERRLGRGRHGPFSLATVAGRIVARPVGDRQRRKPPSRPHARGVVAHAAIADGSQHAIFPDRLLIPAEAQLGDSLLRAVVDVGEAETPRVTARPFEVVHQAPVEVTDQRISFGNGTLRAAR